MSQKWNLQDIRPAEPRQRRRPQSNTLNTRTPVRPPQPRTADDVTIPPAEEHSTEEAPARIPITDRKKERGRGVLVAAILFFVILGAGILFSVATSGAVVTLYPKNRSLTVNAEFTAYKQNTAGELTYELLTLESTGERQVKATGQETVTEQATGEIEIKKSTPGAERLIKNTRFETSDGKIFRIEESVVVPGAVNGTPGRIMAKVFADEAGDQYNIPANTPMTVPGFRENNFTELYNAITASNPQAFTNGVNGPRFIIDENELATARQSLQAELRDKLLAQFQTERPAGFTTFPTATAITFTALPPVQYGNELVTIREQAVLQVPMFKDADFASFIAKESIVGYDPAESVRIENVNDLSFEYLSATTSQSTIGNQDSLDFKISGAPKIVWSFDHNQMKDDLSGLPKTGFINVLSQYPGIERGEVKIRPFWSRSFPDNAEEIEVKEVMPTE